MINVFLSGLTGGAFYIAITWGVVIAYRFSHTLSFANGAVASFSCYFAYAALGRGIPYWLAAIIAIIVAVITNIVVGVAVRTLLRRGSDLTASLATLGPGLALMGLIGIVWGQNVKTLPTPKSIDGPVNIGPYSVPASGLTALAIVVIATLALVLFLRKTRPGVLLRAMADSRAIAALSGVPVARFELLMWGLSGALAGCAGLLITPQLSLTPEALTNLLLIGLAAAVLGGLESLTGLMTGGLLFGVVVALTSYFFQAQVNASTALVVLIVVLAIRPTGLFARKGSDSLGMFPQFIESAAGRRRDEPKAALVGLSRSLRDVTTGARARWQGLAARGHFGSPWGRIGVVAVTSIVLIGVVPYLFSDSDTFMFSTAAILVIAIAGQTVLSELSGILSLAQGGFMLVGSYVAGLVAVKANVNQPSAILLGVLSGVAVAAFVGLCVTRLSGLYLSILTSIVSLAVPEFANNFQSLTGGSNGLYTEQLTIGGRLLDSSADLFRFCAVVAAVVLILIAVFKRSRVGLVCRAVRDSEIGASSVGINVFRPRMIAFCVAGACAGLAGALTTFQLGVVAPASFSLWTSIYVVFACALSGGESIFVGPVVGALVVVGLPYVLSGSGAVSQVIFGVGLVVVLSVRTMLGARSSVREVSEQEPNRDRPQLTESLAIS